MWWNLLLGPFLTTSGLKNGFIAILPKFQKIVLKLLELRELWFCVLMVRQTTRKTPDLGQTNPTFFPPPTETPSLFFVGLLLSNIHFDVLCTFLYRSFFCLSSSMVWVLDVSFLYFFLQLSHFNFWANYNSMTRGPIHFPLLYSNFSWTPLRQIYLLDRFWHLVSWFVF